MSDVYIGGFPLWALDPVPGTEAITVGATAVGLTPPPIADVAILQVLVATIRFTDDGTAPTATLGEQAGAGDVLEASGRRTLESFAAVREGAADATLMARYYVVSPLALAELRAGRPLRLADGGS